MSQYIYSIDDNKILDEYIQILNNHLTDILSDSDDINDFTICNDEEKQIIIHIIYHISSHKRNIPLDIIYITSIYYYYYSVVLEYYVAISYPTDLFIHKRKTKTSIQKVNKLLVEISSSKDKWASYVRRIVHFTDDVTNYSSFYN
jgi:hypothetical protein